MRFLYSPISKSLAGLVQLQVPDSELDVPLEADVSSAKNKKKVVNVTVHTYAHTITNN